ncbi:MAG: hypothetical protein V1664_00600 [Candidatus Uhrbacteria bacterium]
MSIQSIEPSPWQREIPLVKKEPLNKESKPFQREVFKREVTDQLQNLSKPGARERTKADVLAQILEELEDDHAELENGAKSEAGLLAEKMRVVLEMLADEKAANHGKESFDAAIRVHSGDLAELRDAAKKSELDLKTRNEMVLLEAIINKLQELESKEAVERETKRKEEAARAKATEAGAVHEEKGIPDSYEVIRPRASLTEPVEPLIGARNQKTEKPDSEIAALNKKFADLRKESQKFWLWPKTRENLETQMKDIRIEIAALQGGRYKKVEGSPRQTIEEVMERIQIASGEAFYEQKWALKDPHEVQLAKNKLQKEVEKKGWLRFFGRGRDLEKKIRYLELIQNENKMRYPNARDYRV